MLSAQSGGSSLSRPRQEGCSRDTHMGLCPEPVRCRARPGSDRLTCVALTSPGWSWRPKCVSPPAGTALGRQGYGRVPAARQLAMRALSWARSESSRDPHVPSEDVSSPRPSQIRAVAPLHGDRHLCSSGEAPEAPRDRRATVKADRGPARAPLPSLQGHR